MAPARHIPFSNSCWPETSIWVMVTRRQASYLPSRSSSKWARSASLSGHSQWCFAVRKACDRLEEAINATRQGLCCRYLAVAAPTILTGNLNALALQEGRRQWKKPLDIPILLRLPLTATKRQGQPRFECLGLGLSRNCVECNDVVEFNDVPGLETISPQ